MIGRIGGIRAPTPFFPFFALIATALLAPLGPGIGAAETTETAGDVLRVAIPAAAFALTVKHDDRDGRRQFYRSFAANVGATWLLKESVDKARPDGSDDDAFPSGHASMAFQGAAFIHRRYGLRPAWPAYALAGVTAWTRVDSDEHDEADVLAGAALGIAASFLLTDEWAARGASVTPFVGDGAWGVELSARF